MSNLKPIHLPQLIASWDSFNTDALNIAELTGRYFVKHFKSLVGKHFKMVIQKAPFVFFQFMDEPQKELWLSLCNLAPLIYQTTIPRMDKYLEELNQRIGLLFHHIVLMTGRWVNKPKFHMLDHLALSIAHLGNETLFSTEKFESFNSILQKALVHSNHHRPGHDLAVTFANYEAMQAILSGGSLYHQQLNGYFEASSNVTKMFQQPSISQAMGYKNPTITIIYPHRTKKKLDTQSRESIPTNLRSQFPNCQIQQIHSLVLDSKNKIQKDSFVLVSHSCNIVDNWGVILPLITLFNIKPIGITFRWNQQRLQKNALVR